MSLMTAFGQTTTLVFSLPFDIARANYARAVQIGFIEHSLLKSARFERGLGKLEQITLGPWARRV